MISEERAVLVTGANGGLGRQFVSQFLERGASKVYAGTRREMTWDDDRVVPLLLDVMNSMLAAVSAQTTSVCSSTTPASWARARY